MIESTFMIETIKESWKSKIFKIIGVVCFGVVVNLAVAVHTGIEFTDFVRLIINIVCMGSIFTILSYKPYSIERKQGLIPFSSTLKEPLLSPEHYQNEHVAWVQPYQKKFTIKFTTVKQINCKDFIYLAEDINLHTCLSVLDEDFVKILPKIKNGVYTGLFDVRVYKKYTILVPVIPENEVIHTPAEIARVV
jgi:hypothetical protein